MNCAALKSTKFLLPTDVQGHYFWSFGTDHARYLRLPRPDGSPLLAAQSNRDLYVPPDVDFGLALQAPPVVMVPPVVPDEENAGGDVDMEGGIDSDRVGSNANVAIDLDAWRPGLDAQFTEMRGKYDELRDVVEEVQARVNASFAIQKALTEAFNAQFPGIYKEPSEAIDRPSSKRARTSLASDRDGPSSS